MPEFANSADPYEFERQQRAGLARAMLQQGMSAAPVRHWTEGLARMAAALQGRMMTDDLTRETRNLDDKSQARMADLLRVFDPAGGQQPGQPAPTQAQPGMPPAMAVAPQQMGGGPAPTVTVPRAPSGATFEAPGMFGAAPQPQTPLEPGMNVRPQGGLFGGGGPIGQPMAEPPLTLQAGPSATPRPAAAAGLPPDIEQVVRETAQRHGVPYELARAVVMRESTGRHIDPGTGQPIQGAAGERGLMQLMPGTARGLGVDPNDLRQNVDGGIRYLRQQLDRYGNNPALAVAAYNAGPDHRGVLNFARTGDPSGLPPGTRDYIAYVQQQLGGGEPPMAGGNGPAAAGGADVPRGTPPMQAPAGPANRLGFTPEQQRALMAAMLDPRQREQAMAILQFRQAMQPPERAPVSVAPGAALVDPRTGQVVHQQPRETQQPRVFEGPNGQQFLIAPNGRMTPVPQQGQGGAFHGTSMDAQTYNILTNPNADPESQEYGMAYWRATQPRPQVVTDQNGQQQMVLMQPNLPPSIRPPSWARAGGAQPPGVAQPGQPAPAQAPAPPQAAGTPPAPAGGPQPPAAPSPPQAPQTPPQPQQAGRVTVTPVGQARARERPEAEHNRIMVNAEGIGTIDRAMQALQQYPNAIGLGPGAANTTALTRALWDRADQRGAPVRGLIANISSALLLARSGAAVTESEYNRLAAFLPTVGDNYELAMSRLQQLRREYTAIMQARYRATGPESGYRPIPVVEEILGAARPQGNQAPQPGGSRVLRFNAQGEPIQ